MKPEVMQRLLEVLHERMTEVAGRVHMPPENQLTPPPEEKKTMPADIADAVNDAAEPIFIESESLAA